MTFNIYSDRVHEALDAFHKKYPEVRLMDLRELIVAVSIDAGERVLNDIKETTCSTD